MTMSGILADVNYCTGCDFYLRAAFKAEKLTNSNQFFFDFIVYGF